MGDTRYQVIFEGKLQEGYAIESVKKNIAALFKMNAAQVDKIFAGGSVIIKKDADEQTALKYKAAFKKVGAECTLQSSEAAAAPVSSDATPTATASSTATGTESFPRMLKGTRDTVNIAVPDDLSELTLAAPGSDIIANPEEIPVFEIDISELTLAELESGYLVPPHTITPAPIDDISGLKLEPL